MPVQIQTPTPGQRLVRLFGLKGRFQPLLDEIVVPIVDVGAEQIVSRAAWGAGTVAAAAGEFAIAHVLNADASTLDWTGKQVRIDRIHLHGATAGLWYFGIGSTWTLGLQGAMTSAFKDSGLSGQAPVATPEIGRTTFDNAASALIIKQVAAGGVSIDFNDVLLSNGLDFWVQTSVANDACEISFEWTEIDVNAAAL